MKKTLIVLTLALLLSIPSFAAEHTIPLLEEEWTAQDLYESLYKETGEELYNRLYQAERNHEKALLRLLERTGQEVPQRKASELPKTVEEKIAFAIEFEKQDIEDLRKAAEETDDPRAKRVYTNLAKASENHLAALLGEKECPQEGQQFMRQGMDREDRPRGRDQALCDGTGQGQGPRRGSGQGQKLRDNCANYENCPYNE